MARTYKFAFAPTLKVPSFYEFVWPNMVPNLSKPSTSHILNANNSLTVRNSGRAVSDRFVLCVLWIPAYQYEPGDLVLNSRTSKASFGRNKIETNIFLLKYIFNYWIFLWLLRLKWCSFNMFYAWNVFTIK